MSALKSYQMSCAYKDKDGWWKAGVWAGDTWQGAINHWLEYWKEGRDILCQVVSEKPSEDGRSGLMEVTEVPPDPQWTLSKVKATLIENG